MYRADLTLFSDFPTGSVGIMPTNHSPNAHTVVSGPDIVASPEIEDRVINLLAAYPTPIDGVLVRDVILDIEILKLDPDSGHDEVKGEIIIDAASIFFARRVDVRSVTKREFGGLCRALNVYGLLEDVNSLTEAWSDRPTLL